MSGKLERDVKKAPSYRKMSKETKEQLRKADKAIVVEAKNVFQQFDINKDARICRNELKSGLTKMGKDLTDSDVQKLMQKFDSNKDGVLDFAEFLSLVQTSGKKPEKDYLVEMFQEIDKNGDGFIDKDELVEIMTQIGVPVNEMQAKHMIRAADKNDDGKIDFDEFGVLIDLIFNQRKQDEISPDKETDTGAQKPGASGSP